MKYALIIGNNKYDDPKLAQLKTPAADSHALAKILDDKTIGSFDEVTPLINQTETRIRRAISTFLTNKKPDDLVLLYFSGHGVLDDRGRLYLALKDTQVNLLKATSIPSSFIADEMDSCRSKRQILVLDCCHSGAFGRGTKGEQKAITETTFEGSGFGRVVLTASDSTQYALEGDQVIKQTELSLFTHFLLQGLKTGEADTNNDGHISLDEWYDYTYGKVISETPRQVPHKWSYNQQGDLIIAKNPFVKKKVVELPYELLQALESSFFGIRESAVNELGKYLRSYDPEMVELAISHLEKMKQDDSRRISSLAERLLSEFELARTPASNAMSPKLPIPEIKSEPTIMKTEDVLASPRTTPEIESAKATQISQPDIERENIHIETPLVAPKLGFDSLFWLKWIGSTSLGVIIPSVLVNYWYNTFGGSIPVLFGILAGLSSSTQWFFFRNRLEIWWIAANTAAGIVLGSLRLYLSNNYGWTDEQLVILFALWIIGNFVLGPILMRKTPEKLRNFSPILTAKPATELAEMETRQKSEGLVFDSLFFLKWSGTAFLGVILSTLLYNYSLQSITWTFAVPFGIVAGLTSLAQWWVFRDRLESWWIAANVAGGALLGAMYYYFYTTDSWGSYDNFWPFSAPWMIGNFILGLMLMWRTRKKSNDFSSTRAANSVTEWIETGPRRNIFILPLSVSLLLYAFLAFLDTSRDTSFLSIPDWLFNASAIITAAASLWVGVSFILKKDAPRNFGFIALAIFAVLNGIIVIIFTVNPDFPTHFFTVPGIMSLLAGMFFVFQRETWKHLRYIILSGFLIFVSPVYFGIDEAMGTHIFSIIAISFALLSGILFFLRK
jgi:uncharacterized caspase-like protein